jgi:DNA-binding LacI/PurR family transcriptional regulator
VRARVAQLGARAVECLVAMLADGSTEPVQELHSTELVVRRTTDLGASQAGKP